MLATEEGPLPTRSGPNGDQRHLGERHEIFSSRIFLQMAIPYRKLPRTSLRGAVGSSRGGAVISD